jgi:hypothetical protein
LLRIRYGGELGEGGLGCSTTEVAAADDMDGKPEGVSEPEFRESGGDFTRSRNDSEIKAQCEPTEPTEGPTDFPRTRTL